MKDKNCIYNLFIIILDTQNLLLRRVGRGEISLLAVPRG
jgi:hypothetical protein